MKNIFLFGECMIELMTTSQRLLSTDMRQSYAGDVFNTAVYLKRLFSDMNVQLVTAIGEDQFSLKMVQYFESEHIDTNLVFKSKDKIPGLYAIELDETGERSFTYWRDNSAARTIMSYIDEQMFERASVGDVVFFSGISLAVITPQDRPKFWLLIGALKRSGLNIVFDPNYRAQLWKDEAEAKAQFEKAFSLSTMLLPSIDDFNSLYGMNDFEQVSQFLAPYHIEEIIVKNGPDSIISVNENQVKSHAIVPVKNVIDTTSAGDSFNGTYVGARLNGLSITQSIALASTVAGIIIQHKGAIVEKESFNRSIQPYLNA